MNIRLLLDTQVFLWWQIGNPDLPAEVEDTIATADLVFISAVSAWEAAIKKALGKLELELSFEEGTESSGFEKLPVQFVHAARAGALPPHHRDPFDRMLIAQAQEEGLTLVTHDRRLEPYDASFLWV